MRGINGLAAIESDTEEPTLRLQDLQGNVVATASASEAATKLLKTERPTDYGVPTSSKPEKYSWLGGDVRPTELASGVIAMGARSYIPQLGRFLQTDPVSGGSANAYAYVFGDPINQSDPSGEDANGPSEWAIGLANELTGQEVAGYEQAVREEAERKAAEAAAAAAAYAALEAATAIPTEGGVEEAAEGEEEGGGGGGDPVARAAGVDTVDCQGEPSYPHVSEHARRKGLKRVNVIFRLQCNSVMAVLRIRIALYRNHKLVAESGYVTKYGTTWIRATADASCHSGLYQSWDNAAGVPAGGEAQIVNNSSKWGTPTYVKC